MEADKAEHREATPVSPNPLLDTSSSVRGVVERPSARVRAPLIPKLLCETFSLLGLCSGSALAIAEKAASPKALEVRFHSFLLISIS